MSQGGGAFATVLADTLEAAGAALTAENAAEMERLGRAATALIRAKRDLADFVVQTASQQSEQDEDDARAELRRRVARFVEADLSGAPPEVLERIARRDDAE